MTPTDGLDHQYKHDNIIDWVPYSRERCAKGYYTKDRSMTFVMSLDDLKTP